MHPAIPSLILAASLLPNGPPASGVVDDDDAWTRIDSERFTVYSGAGRRAGLQIARRLELLHSALSQLARGDDLSPLPTRVYVFADDAALQPFKPALADGRRGSGRAVAGGFFAPRELGNYVAVNARTSQPVEETIQHEYLHYFARHNLPRLPFWLDEGLAEYYSSFAVIEGRGVVGLPVEQNLRLLAARPDDLSRTALDALEQTRSGRDLYDDAGRAAGAYAASWALVHYLLSDDLRAEKTMDFLRGLAAGGEPKDAFRSAFGQPPSSFSGELRAFLEAGDFPTFRTSLSNVVEPEMAPMAAAERDVVLGDLALQVGRSPLARRLLEDAWHGADRLAEDQRTAKVRGHVLLGEARLDLLGGDPESAVYLARDARELLRGSFEPSLVEARAELQRALEAPGDRSGERRASLVSARRLFRETLRLESDLAAALIGLARAWILDPELQRSPGGVQEAVEGLSRALALQPYRDDVPSLLATVHTLAGRLGLAERVLRRERHRYADQSSWDDALARVAGLEIRLLEGQGRRGATDPDFEDRLHRLESLVRRNAGLGALYREIDALRERLTPR